MKFPPLAFGLSFIQTILVDFSWGTDCIRLMQLIMDPENFNSGGREVAAQEKTRSGYDSSIGTSVYNFFGDGHNSVYPMNRKKCGYIQAWLILCCDGFLICFIWDL